VSAPPTAAELDEFRKLDSVDAVARFFGTSLKRLKYNLYARKRPQYRTFDLRKASGGLRPIACPPPVLAIWQSHLLRFMKAVSRPAPPAHGFTSGRSVLTNASGHVGRARLLTVDLADFFSTFHFGRVRGVFRKQPFGFDPTVAAVLAQLCCYEGILPQGASTSPLLTNMICRRLDRDLMRLAARLGCRYSRYADDFTFSTDALFFSGELLAPLVGGSSTLTIGSALARVLAEHGVKVNESKTRLQTARQRQVVTGVVVNKRPNVTRRFRQNIRAVLHRCEVDGLAATETAFHTKYDRKQRRGGSPALLDHLHGRIDYLGMIRRDEASVTHGSDDPRFARLRIRANRVEPARARPLKVHGRASLERSIVEAALFVIIGLDSGGSAIVQGSAFALAQVGIVSAAHLFDPITPEGFTVARWELLSARVPSSRYPVVAVRTFSGIDVAVAEVSVPLLAWLLRSADTSAADGIRVLGYPVWRGMGDTLADVGGVVRQTRTVGGIRHVLTSAHMQEGMSGGAVLDARGLVLAIATHDATAPGTPNAGIEISHVDEARIGVRRVL